MRKMCIAPLALLLCLLLAPAQAERLDLGDTAQVDLSALCAYLEQRPDVDAVDMYESELTREEMDMLSTRYPHVTFGWTLRFGDHEVRTDATAFSTLHSKRSKAHTDEELSVLKYCKNLIALDLGHNDIDDIRFLSELPRLRVLILGRNRVEDISVLAELTELEYAELFSNRITDISALAGLTKLRDLNLTNNPIEDVTPLFGLSGLERLWCGMNARLGKAQLSALREALPLCEIDGESHPTGGTWRRHPRYEVICAMFSGSTYIPFAD